MISRLPIPHEHTRSPLLCPRTTAALIIAVAFAAGAAVTVWAVALFLV